MAASGAVWSSPSSVPHQRPAPGELAGVMPPITTCTVRMVSAEWRRKSNVIAEIALRNSGFSDAEELGKVLVGARK
jgi:hypothetical protein